MGLTKRAVDAAKPKPRKTGDVYVWDDEVIGFGLRVRSTGSKFYVYRYSRGKRGQTARVTIGRHGSPWTVEGARDEAKRLQAAVADGRDPAKERQVSSAMPILEECAVRFITEYARPHTQPTSAEAYRYALVRAGIADVPQVRAAETRRGRAVSAAAKIALDPIARLRIDRVQTADVAALHFKRRHTPIDANRLLAVLSKLFSLAEREWGLRPAGSNPCRGIKRYPEERRERFLSDAELARLGKALAQAEAEWTRAKRKKRWTAEDKEAHPLALVDPIAVGAIKLLIFTGARLSEVMTAKWEAVDNERATLLVPRPKEGKPKMLRLGPPALAVLKTLPRIKGNPYIIAGRTTGKHLTDLQHPWQRIRSVAKLEDVRLHDLRHSHASVAAASGESLIVIGALLGHRQPSTTARYAHLSDDRLGAVAKTTSERIASAMGVGEREAEQEAGEQAKPAGELVPMRKTKAGGR